MRIYGFTIVVVEDTFVARGAVVVGNSESLETWVWLYDITYCDLQAWGKVNGHHIFTVCDHVSILNVFTQ